MVFSPMPEAIKLHSNTYPDQAHIMKTGWNTELHYLYKNYSMNLFVAGLPYDLDDAELEEIFEKFGKVISAKVSIDRETGKSRGFGFVQMEKDADAKDAIEHLNDIYLGKKPLVVKAAEDRPGGGGGYKKPGFGNDRRRY